MSLAIVWFRRDLRLADHPALEAAARRHERIVPVYVHAPEEEGEWAPGAASQWWLHHSLKSLDADLRRHHGTLHMLRGPSLDALRKLATSAGAEAVYWNRLYEPAVIKRDAAIKQSLRDAGLHVASFDAALLRSPWQVLTRDEGPYKVFTPFWRNLRAQLGDDEAPLPVPQPLSLHQRDDGLSVDDLGLLPELDWANGFSKHWHPGEQGAMQALDVFADDALSGYAELRDRPARAGTSRLSPHLHFGEVTPRMLVAALRERKQDDRHLRGTDLEPWLREVGWRDFAHHVLYHFPHTADRNMDDRFDAFAWQRSRSSLERWQRGRTGIPLVDAGMRELWATGWMHNRVRMIVGSWLTKNMRHHWLEGARWFWDTLVDADLANNTMGWQWVAGCGVDAAPYFRIFNPVTQSERFDPDGEYLRRWLPELEGVQGKAVHQPWVEDGLPERCGYPMPMLDPKASRKQALEAWESMRDAD